MIHSADLAERLTDVLSTRRDLTLDELDTDTQERWMVERGVQLCAQNALDIATHIAASRGRDQELKIQV